MFDASAWSRRWKSAGDTAKPRPWTLGRPTNAASGHIFRTRRITWAEMAMLHLLTKPSYRAARSYGNPTFTDFMAD